MATVVNQQPVAVSQVSTWDTDLLSCCDDMKTCCYAFWCFPCFACSTAGNFGENRCLPLLDILSPSALSLCGIPLFVPPALLAMRVGVRHTYGIKGSLCRDIWTSCFCVWCSWCQIARELKKRKKSPTVITIQSQPAK